MQEEANNPMAQQMQHLQAQVLQATAREKEAKAMKYQAQANDPNITLPKVDK